jgi:hypothetical protein
VASGTFAWYGPGLKRILEGDIDLNAHTFKAALASSSYTPNQDTHDDWADVSANEVTGTNWAAGGQTLSITTGIDTANNRVSFTATDISVASVTLSDGKHLVIYDDTHASDALVGYITFDTALAPSNGPLDIDFGTEVGRITY